MGFENRDYYKNNDSSGSLMGRMKKGSVVTWLIGINAAIFLLDNIFSSAQRAGGFTFFRFGYFSFDTAIQGLQIWRVLTYQFLHANFFHVFFNMLGLYFFGPMLEQWWGSRRFLAFYLLCGASGAFLYVGLALIPGLLPHGTESVLVGASGAIFGILAAAAVIAPNRQVMLLFPPIPMQLRTMVLIFLGLAVLQIILGSHNAGGEAAHIGGAILGYYLIKNPALLNFADRMSADAIQAGYNKGRFEKKLKQERQAEDELDQLLAKVSDQGLHSLSPKEKKRLNQLSEQKRKG